MLAEVNCCTGRLTCATMLPRGQPSSVHRSRLKTTYCTSGSMLSPSPTTGALSVALSPADAGTQMIFTRGNWQEELRVGKISVRQGRKAVKKRSGSHAGSGSLRECDTCRTVLTHEVITPVRLHPNPRPGSAHRREIRFLGIQLRQQVRHGITDVGLHLVPCGWHPTACGTPTCSRSADRHPSTLASTDHRGSESRRPSTTTWLQRLAADLRVRTPRVRDAGSSLVTAAGRV